MMSGLIYLATGGTCGSNCGDAVSEEVVVFANEFIKMLLLNC